MNNIYKIDLAIVGVSLVALIFLVGYVSPLVISPLDNYESSEASVLFSVEKAEAILIDDNIGFSSPDSYSVRDGLQIDLEPGEYFWKAVGVVDSDVRTLTIKSRVSLEFRDSEGGYDVVNSGNVRLNVDVYDGMKLVEQRQLEVGESVDGGDKYVGGYDG